MDTRQEAAEPERREGFGGRVRRFIDNELSRALDKDEPGPDTPATTDSIEEPAAAEPVSQQRLPAADPASQPVPEAQPASRPATAEAVSRRSERDAADSSAQRVGLLNDPAGLRDQWQQVQGTFVDDPQEAVHQASMLV